MALRTYLTGIADAIREKKGTSDPINAQDFASEISSISTGGGDEDTIQALIDSRQGSASYLFSYGTVNMWSNLNWSSVTEALNMLDHATVEGELDIYLPNAVNLNGLCQYSKFTKIKVATNTNQTYYGAGFRHCVNAKVIDLSSIVGSYSDSSLCRDCYSLTKFIIRTMDPLPAFPYDAFSSCYHFTGQYSSTYNPNSLRDARIYVPDDKVDALKAATNWSDYADFIVPLSTLVED